jgi:hypothetical protein
MTYLDNIGILLSGYDKAVDKLDAELRVNIGKELAKEADRRQDSLNAILRKAHEKYGAYKVSWFQQCYYMATRLTAGDIKAIEARGYTTTHLCEIACSHRDKIKDNIAKARAGEYKSAYRTWAKQHRVTLPRLPNGDKEGWPPIVINVPPELEQIGFAFESLKSWCKRGAIAGDDIRAKFSEVFDKGAK